MKKVLRPQQRALDKLRESIEAWAGENMKSERRKLLMTT